MKDDLKTAVTIEMQEAADAAKKTWDFIQEQKIDPLVAYCAFQILREEIERVYEIKSATIHKTNDDLN